MAAPSEQDDCTPPTSVAGVYPTEGGGEAAEVVVSVSVDASGRVTEAVPETGAEVFREAAVQAVQQVVFPVCSSSAEAGGTTTKVVVRFRPPGPDSVVDDDYSVVVHGSEALEDTRPRVVIDEQAIERAAGDDLAEVVAQTPGVTLAGGYADASKPIIRGQQERRLLMLFDGVRHENQKWGPDHATEIDPFSAGEITVIRGAAGTRYGPDAIGGVVLVEPPALRDTVGVGGKAVMGFSVNGRRPFVALRMDAVPKNEQWTVRVEGNVARGASLMTPTYVLGNTASQVWNAGTTIAHRWKNGELRAVYHHHDFRAGVFYGVQSATRDALRDLLEADRPITADAWTVSYNIDRGYQDVMHDIAVLHLDVHGDWGELESTVAFQVNDRREFEQTRKSITGPQYDFLLRTTSVDTVYSHPDRSVGSALLTGGVGLQGMFQENVYQGLTLLPNYRGVSGGLFAYERLTVGRVDVEAGARYDGLSRVVYMQQYDYQRHERRGTLDLSECTVNDDVARCPTAFDAASFSLGGLWHVVPETVDLKLDLSSANRFPNLDELYLIGATPSLPVFALGDPGLDTETSWGGSLTGGLRLDWLEAEVSGFASRVDDYIYFAPELNEAGELAIDVTIRGAYPRYSYRSIQAGFYGVDGSFVLAPYGVLGLDVQGALVRAYDLEDGEFLIGTPADRLSTTVKVRPAPVGAFRETELAVTTELIARQSRVNPNRDFAEAPDGVVLLGASLQTEVALGRRSFRVGIEARNLLNARYREYTSLMRYFADQPGRDLRVRLGANF